MSPRRPRRFDEENAARLVADHFPGATVTEGGAPPLLTNRSKGAPMRPLTPHPAAEAFPMADDDTLNALAADVATHGLREPIVVHDDGDTRWLVDGRNRLEACHRAGVQPTFAAYDGDPAGIVALVVSANLARRHLTIGQRACLAVELLLPGIEAAADERMRRGTRTDPVPNSAQGPQGRSVERAARMVGVGKQSVVAAKKLRAEIPVAFEEVRAGTITLAGAWKRAEEPTPASSLVDEGAALMAEIEAYGGLREFVEDLDAEQFAELEEALAVLGPFLGEAADVCQASVDDARSAQEDRRLAAVS